MLAKIVIDKFSHHLPEHRQVKQYSDMGLNLPTSTINDWVHAVAAKLDAVYEAQLKPENLAASLIVFLEKILRACHSDAYQVGALYYTQKGASVAGCPLGMGGYGAAWFCLCFTS